MNNEQLNEHIVNDIKELKQHIIIIENLIQNFRISFLHHKHKEKEELQMSLNKFNDNLPNFIKKEISNITKKFIHELTYPYNDGSNHDIYNISTLFPLTCYEITELFILKILIKEKQIKFYENLIKLYSDKPDIGNIMELYPEKPKKPEIKNKQYSISPCVIFLIMIIFYIITVTTVIMLINNNDSTTELGHPIQCIMPTFKNTQFIDKHNKLKDLMII
jgi:hypothetical protein